MLTIVEHKKFNHHSFNLYHYEGEWEKNFAEYVSVLLICVITEVKQKRTPLNFIFNVCLFSQV
ncbi:hypothetical protein BK749_14195 [Bacillus thuringiensis serovar vazensis]|uniref:Uncharacterized protein n=1 Tax=Bacillus thuringiensis serovar vazensis TaxID=180867 RepID=A0A243CW46_BACTU|nr:hypothetical protein BK749_14195 [Bacillus thuringiensis serovar vazensis]